MRIRVNGKFLESDDPQSLNDFIEQTVKQQNFLVAELNGQIIKRPDWQTIRLNDGDSLELVTLFGGG